MQAAAEYLYDILTKVPVVKKRVPVLVFCNKTNKVTAHSKEFIKKQLEKEVDKWKKVASRQVDLRCITWFTLSIHMEVDVNLVIENLVSYIIFCSTQVIEQLIS